MQSAACGAGDGSVEIHPAMIAKAEDGLAGFGVDGDDVAIERSHEEAFFAFCIGPVRNAAGEPAHDVSLHAFFVSLGIVDPFSDAGCGINGCDLVEAGTDVHHAADQKGRGFEPVG